MMCHHYKLGQGEKTSKDREGAFSLKIKQTKQKKGEMTCSLIKEENTYRGY